MSTDQAILALIRQARSLLEQAINLMDAGAQQPDTPPIITGTAVFYGKDGYTDASDPRTPATRTHVMTDGRPTAVWLTVLMQPQTRYQAVQVDLLPNDQACNVYVSVMGKDGNAVTATNARMLTGWQESATSYDALIDAPNSPGSYFMGADSKFWPPNIGPIGACMVDENGHIASDIVGGMGLPNGAHCSYRIVFRER